MASARGVGAKRALAAFALGACAVAAACSVLVPLDDVQCNRSEDCSARGASFTGASCVNHVCQPSTAALDAGADAGEPAAHDPWACLSKPPEVLDPAARVDIEFVVFDALGPITTAGSIDGGSDFSVISGTFLPGVSIYGCNLLDPSCAKPVTPTVVSDDGGVAHLTLPGDFVGFFVLSRPDMLSATLYAGQLLAGSPLAIDPTPMLETQATELLAQALGLPLVVDGGADGGAPVGLAFLQVYDCDDHHAEGVTFAFSVHGPQMVQFYTSGQIPSSTADRTDALGAGGAINVPVGSLTVTATLASNGRTLGSATTYVRAGGTSFAWLRPRTR